MKDTIHPKIFETKVSCACGEAFSSQATVPEIRVEICSRCHPFFTGKQKFVDTAGRVEKFQAKYGTEVPKRSRKTKKAEPARKKVTAAIADDAEPIATADGADANG